MGTKIRIRQAEGNDVVRLAKLLTKAAREQAEKIWYPQPSSNTERRLGSLLSLICNGYVVLADAIITNDDGKAVEQHLVGAIGMAFARDGWSDDWCLNNEWFYVHPEWRDTEIADKLLNAVEQYADTRTHPQTRAPVKVPIVLGIFTGEDAELKAELMKRRGWQYGGANFVRAPTDEQHQEDHANVEHSDVAGERKPTGDESSSENS